MYEQGNTLTLSFLKGKYHHAAYFHSLQELDQLYREDSLDAYERLWQETARFARQMLPSFTIAYAELYNSGICRLSDAAMSHVLVPIPQQQKYS